MIPGARFVEVAGASHLGVFTHAETVAGDRRELLRRGASWPELSGPGGQHGPCPARPSCSPAAPSTGWGSEPCSSPVPACSDHRPTAAGALAVLRRAVDAGVDHIDTAQFYGPDVANELIHRGPPSLSGRPGAGVQGRRRARRRGPVAAGPASRGTARRGRGQPRAASSSTRCRWSISAAIPGSDVPFAEQLVGHERHCDEGLIGGIGLSNVTLDDYVAARSRDRRGLRPERLQPDQPGRTAPVRRLSDDAVPFVPFFPLGSAFFPENPVLGRPGRRRRRRSRPRRPPRPRWPWPGCWPRRPRCCSSRERRRSATWTRTWPPASSRPRRRGPGRSRRRRRLSVAVEGREGPAHVGDDAVAGDPAPAVKANGRPLPRRGWPSERQRESASRRPRPSRRSRTPSSTGTGPSGRGRPSPPSGTGPFASSSWVPSPPTSAPGCRTSSSAPTPTTSPIRAPSWG